MGTAAITCKVNANCFYIQNKTVVAVQQSPNGAGQAVQTGERLQTVLYFPDLAKEKSDAMTTEHMGAEIVFGKNRLLRGIGKNHQTMFASYLTGLQPARICLPHSAGDAQKSGKSCGIARLRCSGRTGAWRC